MELDDPLSAIIFEFGKLENLTNSGPALKFGNVRVGQIFKLVESIQC